MKYIVTEPQSIVEPVTIAEALAHTRAIDDGSNIDLKLYISAAREYAESFTGRAFHTCTVKAYPDSLSGMWQLPKSPLAAMPVVKIRTAGGIVTLDDDELSADLKNGCVKVMTNRAVPEGEDAIEVEYTAGYTVCPYAVKAAILLLTGYWYNNRETVAVGSLAAAELPMASRNLLQQYKVWWF